MKTKDVIAFWLLLLFVFVPFSRAFYGLIDALKLNQPLCTILWYVGVTIAVAAFGLFLVVHFMHRMHDLQHYEADERQREKECERKTG
jgi:uncharacterized membrane protein